MAKKRGRKTTRLDSAAIAAGSALGSLAAKVEQLNRQRADVAREIQDYIGQAQKMLGGISVSEVPLPRLFGKAKKAAKNVAAAAPKAKRKMSAKARKAISEAQKARWAATKGKAAKAKA